MWHNTCSGSNFMCDIVACGPPVILPHVVVPNSHLIHMWFSTCIFYLLVVVTRLLCLNCLTNNISVRKMCINAPSYSLRRVNCNMSESSIDKTVYGLPAGV